MADVPGDPGEPAAAAMGAETDGAGRRRAAGPVGGARRDLLRQGVRHHVSGPAAHRRGGGRPGGRPHLGRRHVCLRAAVLPGRPSPRPHHRWARAGRARPRRRDAAAAIGSGLAVDRADRGGPQLVQRHDPPDLPGELGDADCDLHPPLRDARDAPERDLGLRLSAVEPRDRIHQLELRHADPARIRIDRVRGQGKARHAGAGRDPRGAFPGKSVRPRLALRLRPAGARGDENRRPAQSAAIPHDPPLSHAHVLGADLALDRGGGMALILDLLGQAVQMLLVVAVAPLLLGVTRKVKARLMRRRGPPLLQPYSDLGKLLHKEAVLATNASWLYRTAPYVIFAATWVAAALVPTYATGLLFSWSADLIAIVALIGTGRFALALAGMDVGTSFGGIGSSRQMLIASLAEPAMLLVVFAVALLAGTTQLSSIAAQMIIAPVGLRVSLALALFAFVFVAIAENGRIPIDNPATHLELTMVHEAMVLEYSGRHLAMIEAAAAVRLVLYFSLPACLFFPFGMATENQSLAALALGLATYLVKILAFAVLLPIGETLIAKMRVFRYPV